MHVVIMLCVCVCVYTSRSQEMCAVTLCIGNNGGGVEGGGARNYILFRGDRLCSTGSDYGAVAMNEENHFANIDKNTDDSINNRLHIVTIYI